MALVEVGLGGRLDATHAWDGGVAVLTNVGLDHTDRLGPTVTAIAREKAAIVERGDVAVTGATGDGLAVIRRRCARLGVPLTVAGPAPVLGWDRDTQRVALPGLGPTDIALRGRHQAANVAVADALLDALEAAGIARTPAAARRRGYATARWPGRLELVDVATPAASGRCCSTARTTRWRRRPRQGARRPPAVPRRRPGGPAAPPVLVWASMADKDVPSILAAIAASPAIDGATVVCTALDVPRAMPAAELARRLAGRAPRQRPSARSPTPTVPSTSRWRPATARWSWPGPCTSSARRARGWSTTRCCATRWRHDARRAAGGAERRPGSSGGGRRRVHPVVPAARRRVHGVPGAPDATVIGPATFAWGERTYVMGVLNVTPDSFSGDGLLAAADPVAAAVEQARRMVADGADLLDVGGASTRPGHDPVDAAEEAARVIPVVRALAAALPATPISIDTTTPAVAEAALDAGAHLLNDVWGVADDPGMVGSPPGAACRSS